MNSLTEITQMLRAVLAPSELPLELTLGVPPTLEQCREIAKLGQQGELAGRRLTGWALNQAKAQLPHGDFLPWAKKELGLSRFSVADYMIVDREWDRVMAKDPTVRSIRAFMQVLDGLNKPVQDPQTPKALPRGGGAEMLGAAQHLGEAPSATPAPSQRTPTERDAFQAAWGPQPQPPAAPEPVEEEQFEKVQALWLSWPAEWRETLRAEFLATSATPATTAAPAPEYKAVTAAEQRRLAGGNAVVCTRCGTQDSLEQYDDDVWGYWPYLCADCEPLHEYDLWMARLPKGTYTLGDLRENVGVDVLLCSYCRDLVDFVGWSDDEEVEWPLLCAECEEKSQHEDEDGTGVDPEAVGYAHAMVLLATAALRVLDEVYAEARHALEAEGVPQLGQFLPSENGEAQPYNYMGELERTSNYAHKSRQIEGCLPALIDAMHRACGHTDEIDRAFARGVQRAHTEFG